MAFISRVLPQKAITQCVALVLSVFGVSTSGVAQEDAATKQEHIQFDNSIKDAVFSNFRAWQSGDVLFSAEEILDTSKIKPDGDTSGVIFKRVILTRSVFDFEHNKFAVFNLRYDSTIDFDNEPEKSEKQTFSGVCYDGTGDHVLMFVGGEPRKIRRNQFPKDRFEFLRQIGFADCRSLAYTGNTTPLKRFESERDTSPSSTGQFVESTKQTGDILEIISIIQNGLKLNPEDQSRMRQRYDVRILMPISAEAYSIEPGGNERFILNRRFDWKDIGGIHVPVSYASKMGGTRAVNSRKHVGVLKTDYKFHWFSLNEPVDTRFFDGSRFEDNETFLQFVDPVQAGATTLIPSGESGEVEKQTNSD